jgi:glutathione S-transferase
VGTRLLRKVLGINANGYARSVETTRRIVNEVGERLADGRRYLCGDRFSAADLSFAAMLAPAIVPSDEDYGAVLPSIESLPDDAQDIVRELREHPAGRFAQRMFREERRRA